MNSDAKKMTALVEKILKKEDFEYEKDFDVAEDETLIRLTFSVKRSFGKIRSCIRINNKGVFFIGGLEIVASKRLKEVTEYLHRVNQNRFYGKLILDWEDGSVYSAADSICPDVLDEEFVASHVFYPADLFMDYGDGLMKVIFAGMSPKDAFEEAEKMLDECESEKVE